MNLSLSYFTFKKKLIAKKTPLDAVLHLKVAKNRETVSRDNNHFPQPERKVGKMTLSLECFSFANK